MMWDTRGNEFPPNAPRSPQPHFPIPFPGAPPEMSQPHSAYPKPFMPLGVSSIPPVWVHGSNPYPTYNTFPRSSPPRLSRGVSPAGEGPRLRMPSPAPTPQPPPVHATRQPSHGHHSSRVHAHRTRKTSADARHVHYEDDLPRGQGSSHHVQASSTLHQARKTVVTKQSSETHRVRLNSTGSAMPRPVIPQAVQQPQHKRRQGFEYSKCTGRKKALCIGINYTGQKRELRGCINDIKRVKSFLIRDWGYHEKDIVMLMDETNNPRQMPTRRNILDAMRWLVRDAQPHDSLFFHYSGHGGQIPDTNGDETDGLDEVIYPVDYKQAGIIVDDEMHRIMVKSLPRGCRLTAIFDSCHSGTALDLPFVYRADGRLGESPVTQRARREMSTEADVISFSACRDDQTSADTTQRGVAVGAMSYAFITSLTQKPRQSYQALLRSVREILQRYEQIAQLSSSHRIDTNLQFIL